METKIKNLLARLAFFAEEGMAEPPIVAIAKDADALLKEMCRQQQAQPVALRGVTNISMETVGGNHRVVLHVGTLGEMYKLGKVIRAMFAAEGCGACGDGCQGHGCRLERESPPTCQTCNGQGMIGGLLPNGGGYDGESCPDCATPQAAVGVPEAARLLAAIEYAEGMLTNLQPHIPQACYPQHMAFIDNYVDPVLERLRAEIDAAQEGGDK